MAFKMTPSGSRKCPYSPLQQRGLISPVYQKKETIPEVTYDGETDEEKTARLKAEAEAKADYELNKADYKVITEDSEHYKKDQIGYIKEGEGDAQDTFQKRWETMTEEERGKFKDFPDFEQKGKDWNEKNKKSQIYYEPAKGRDVVVKKKDYYTKNLATFLSENAYAQPKDLSGVFNIGKDAEGNWPPVGMPQTEKRQLTVDELIKKFGTDDKFNTLYAQYREATGETEGRDDLDQNIENVEQGTEKQSETDQPSTPKVYENDPIENEFDINTNVEDSDVLEENADKKILEKSPIKQVTSFALGSKVHSVVKNAAVKNREKVFRAPQYHKHQAVSTGYVTESPFKQEWEEGGKIVVENKYKKRGKNKGKVKKSTTYTVNDEGKMKVLSKSKGMHKGKAKHEINL